MQLRTQLRGARVRRLGLVLAALGLVLATLSAPGPASAKTKLQSAQARLSQLEKQITSQEQGLAQLQKKMASLSGDLVRVHQAYDATLSQLLDTRVQLTAAEESYQAIRQRLDERAVQSFMQGSSSSADFVLGSNSIGDLLDRIQYLSSMQQYDSTLADQADARAEAIDSARSNLQHLNDQQTQLVTKLQEQTSQIGQALADQQTQLQELNASRAKALAIVNKLSIPVSIDVVGGGVAYGKWASGLLTALGDPTCKDNMVVVIAWQAAEGTSAAYNPLATTHQMPGSTSFNSVGVQNYTSAAQGIQASIDTLKGGSSSYGYGAILDGLAGCAPALDTAAAIRDSSWCGPGCAGGAYVIGLVPAVEENYSQYF